jgi:hypothetical protein
MVPTIGRYHDDDESGIGELERKAHRHPQQGQQDQKRGSRVGGADFRGAE